MVTAAQRRIVLEPARWTPYKLGAALVGWWDFSQSATLTTAYISTGTTGTGTSGTSTITTAANVSTVVVAGSSIKLNADVYTVASIATTTITTSKPLINNYSSITVNVNTITNVTALRGPPLAFSTAAPILSVSNFNSKYPASNFTTNQVLTGTLPVAVGASFSIMAVAFSADTVTNTPSAVFVGGGSGFGFTYQSGAYIAFAFGGAEGDFVSSMVAAIWVGIANAGAQTIRVNGTAGTTSGSGATGGGTAVRIGQGLNAHPMNGPVSEVIIVNRSLTLKEAQKVEGYEAWRWGLQASLPTNHPYRFRAP